MKTILHLHLEKGEFGHGYLLAGDFDTARGLALQCSECLLGGRDAKLGGSPDFFHQKYDLFGVEDSRELRGKASKRAVFEGGAKVFVIEIASFNMESANALLKLFEEPTENTHFFVIAPSVESVIPTLRSRLTVVDFSSGSEEKDKEKTIAAKEFLSVSPAERMKIAEDISKRKDREGAIELLNGIEILLARELGSSASNPKGKPSFQVQTLQSLEQIQKARQYFLNRTPFMKMVLEHVALSV